MDTPQNTVTYQVPRAFLVRTHFRRMLFRRRNFRSLAFFSIAFILLYFSGRQISHYLFYFFVGAAVVLPIALYRAIVRIVDRNPSLTDLKTLTFTPEGIAVTGPTYKSEVAWSFFKAFSEDDSYFYLHVPEGGFDSLIPKSAFTGEQQEAFRKCAGVLGGAGVAPAG